MAETRPVVSSKEMITAMLHQGYHTIYALAEIIDNAVQANAKHIEILCMDDLNIDNNRKVLKEIAVLDDGKGMSQDVLWDSIRLGQSQNRGKGGIGRFGVGLTHASFSQCTKLDIYSWQKQGKILHVQLDLGTIGKEIVVEKPTSRNIPEVWKRASKYINRDHGTLVIWSGINRCRWKKAKTLIDHSNLTLGRIYRKFLTGKDKIIMRMISFDNGSGEIDIEENVVVNDPLYLTTPSSTPGYEKNSMFEKDGKLWEVKNKIMGSDGKEYDVVTRYSYVKKEVRKGKTNPGAEPFGKHAAENVGVSIIRAKRELALDTSMNIQGEPTERWWGAEIEFPPVLDDVFGVSTNKQHAAELTYIMKEAGKQARSTKGMDDIIGEEDNPLHSLVRDISARLYALRGTVDKQRKNKRKGKDSGGPTIIDPSGGDDGVTGKQREEMSPDECKKAIRTFMKQMGIDDEGDLGLDDSIRFEFAPLDGNRFFSIGLVGGVKIITINVNHRAYKYLLMVLFNQPSDGINPDDAVKLVANSARGFQKFLGAWANMENERMNPDERNKLADIRDEWGRHLQEYFKADENT